MKNATVYHNIATDSRARHVAMVSGYQSGHPLVPVLRFDAPKDLSDDLRICEYAFTRFNVGDDITFRTPDPLAMQYLQRGNRPMSVGDVVHLRDGTQWSKWYACTSMGFLPVEEPAWFAIGASTYNTKSLPVEDFDTF